MHRTLFATLFALFVALYAANSETFVGTAAATGTYKRPLLVVDGKRYELEASDKADASVAERLAQISKGDSGTYTINGTRATVNKNDGILVDSIAPTSIGHANVPIDNLVNPNTFPAVFGKDPNALSRFSNTQLIILGIVVLGACVALCILAFGAGYWWQHSKSRNK